MPIRLPSVVLPVPRFAPRDPNEPSRATTPLELLFDLAAVVAIGAAAHGLAGALAGGYPGDGIIGFLCSFFMIWWAWMNYTWFASAYDDGSTAFRGLTMMVMFGALLMAAGLDAVFAHQRIWLSLSGFIVMRLGMAALWLGAARGDAARRATALRYATGILAMQLYWIAFVAVVAPLAPAYLPLFLLGAAGELAVPVIAERRRPTTWHRPHIMARYGRLNLIVLGQCFIAIVAAIRLSADGAGPDLHALWLAVLFTLVAFSMWSLYFSDEEHLSDDTLRRALLWGYGHFVVFGAGAAAAAGMWHVLDSGGDGRGALALVLPAAIYLAALWAIRDRYCLQGRARWTLPCAALLTLALGPLPAAGLDLVALTLVATALLRRRLSHRGE